MALNGNRLGDAILAAVDGIEATAGQTVDRTALFRAIGNAIVSEITTNAQVPAGIAVATAGSATNQTGATTAPGTVI